MQVIETRLLCSQARLASWEGGKSEPGIAVAVRTVAIEPPRWYAEAISFLLSAGDHSVARYFERVDGANDVELVSDLTKIAAQYPSLAPAGGKFELAGSAGKWVGQVIERANADRLLRVQTLIEPEARRCGFKLEEIARLVP